MRNVEKRRAGEALSPSTLTTRSDPGTDPPVSRSTPLPGSPRRGANVVFSPTIRSLEDGHDLGQAGLTDEISARRALPMRWVS